MNHCLWLMEDTTFCDRELPGDEKFCPHHADASVEPPEDDFWTRIDGGVFDRQGRAISMQRWGELRETDKRVAESTIKGFCISTVWLGIDHGWGSYRPVIFETMIFAAEPRRKRDKPVPSGDWEYQDRYCTEKEALRGHSDICRAIHSGWRPNR